MSIKLKAQERQTPDREWAFTINESIHYLVDNKQVVSEASLRSGISKNSINAAWESVGEVIKSWLKSGHEITIPGLGTLKIDLKTKDVPLMSDIADEFVTDRNYIFTPNADLKAELLNTPIDIDIFDKNGNLVGRVTSNDNKKQEEDEIDELASNSWFELGENYSKYSEFERYKIGFKKGFEEAKKS